MPAARDKSVSQPSNRHSARQQQQTLTENTQKIKKKQQQKTKLAINNKNNYN